ncbi:hypothetical protein B0J12DRAFT_686549 [Macrophomina phaseolina]|uniref:Fungal-type protein kinase domain-containing protein n=1 Tax=Macrophomina phaseolina TaxID=35725 RepID=A0ABQ8FVR5_9PEZI|nr:hypothetical protein B0J12DRAFT_686549 [Macrophomina phaseolina]
MNEEEIGFDPTITEDDGGRYIEIQQNGRAERIYLEKLMNRQRSIASQATTCWKGCARDKPGDELVKDSWQYEEYPEEGLLLKEAVEPKVNNMARYYRHDPCVFETLWMMSAGMSGEDWMTLTGEIRPGSHDPRRRTMSPV